VPYFMQCVLKTSLLEPSVPQFTADLVYNPCEVHTTPVPSFYNLTDTSSTLASLPILPIQLALHDATSCPDQPVARLVDPYLEVLARTGHLPQVSFFGSRSSQVVPSKVVLPLRSEFPSRLLIRVYTFRIYSCDIAHSQS